jgi:hypothetical protein
MQKRRCARLPSSLPSNVTDAEPKYLPVVLLSFFLDGRTGLPICRRCCSSRINRRPFCLLPLLIAELSDKRRMPCSLLESSERTKIEREREREKVRDTAAAGYRLSNYLQREPWGKTPGPPPSVKWRIREKAKSRLFSSPQCYRIDKCSSSSVVSWVHSARARSFSNSLGACYVYWSFFFARAQCDMSFLRSRARRLPFLPNLWAEEIKCTVLW